MGITRGLSLIDVASFNNQRCFYNFIKGGSWFGYWERTYFWL